MSMTIALLVLLAAQAAPREENIPDADYARYAAKIVREVEAIGKAWKADPAESLKSLEAVLAEMEQDFLPRYPKHVEAVLAVRETRGITKGEVKGRHAFYPYRLAGEIALAAGRPDRAVEFLAKSPGSADLLARARAEAAERSKPAPVLRKPAGPDLAPFLAREDFAGALDALTPHRDRLGAEFEPLLARITDAARKHQSSWTRTVAAALPGVDEADFAAKFVEPCLKACARVPASMETPELAWIRSLGEWSRKKDPAQLDRLAVAAARLDPGFHALVRVAQERRLAELEKLAAQLARTPAAERPPLVERLGVLKRAFETLSAAREYADLKDELVRLEQGLPINEEALQLARQGVRTSSEIVALAVTLEGLWDSDRRGRLSLPDQNDLALYAGLYRCLALFLDGKTVAEVARDPRVRAFFQTPAPLPADAPPKVSAVRDRLQ